MHYVKGRTTTQAHVSIPEGTVEEEYGRSGFSGQAACAATASPTSTVARAPRVAHLVHAVIVQADIATPVEKSD
jgi:hypothetical protein